MIYHLKYESIDKVKWDDCLAAAINENIYACSWYLDAVCPGWEALVDDDYRAVMPLTLNKKWGISYLYQPYLTPQLGIFSKDEISAGIIQRFLEAIPSNIRFAEIFLNYGNTTGQLKSKINQVLELSRSYNEIKKGYSESHAKNLRRAFRNDVLVNQTDSAYQFLDFMAAMNADYLNEKIKQIADKLLPICKERNKLLVYKAVKDNRILSMAVFLIHNRKAYLIISATSEEGKQVKAMFAIVDSFIKDQSTGLNLLDFAGSSIEGIASFNRGFGAIDCSYPFFYLNRLPFYIRWLK